MQIVKIQNPFNLADSEVFCCLKQMSVQDIADKYNVSPQNLPYICFLNGEPLLRQYWNMTPKDTDHVVFLCLPQGGGGGGSFRCGTIQRYIFGWFCEIRPPLTFNL